MDVTKSWERKNNILVFDEGWQLPAKTELWAYESFEAQLPYSPLIEMVCFPWASLVDFMRKNQEQRGNFLVNALQCAPPKTTLKRATVCQHIYALDLIPWLKKLKITDLFWSHATKLETEIEGIKIHPFPLYPYAYASLVAHKIKPLDQRQYLYSFVGAYDSECYLKDTREKVFSLPKKGNSLILKTNAWHFEDLVYKEQILGMDLDCQSRKRIEEKETLYTDVMSDTIYSLCPSGSGPNTIRFWESLMFGCVPVVLSDLWRPPSFLNDQNIIFLREDGEQLHNWAELIQNKGASSSLSQLEPTNYGLSLNNLCMLSLTNNFFKSFS